MKKVLALVLAFAMVFSSISFAFADTTVAAAKSAEAVACEKLGMVKGDGGEISADYYAKEATRLQAAIMVLRLKGLEQEALAFVGEKNFADMAEYKWAGGKNIAAYLLAHPELGFAGDGKNFMADQKITEQMYYKVMLTALGYKQTTPEVVGDFAYADVIAFAKEKGLAPQGLTTFTNGDIAKVTVEGLKAKNKDGKVLVDALVAAGTLKAEAVAEAGIVVTPENTVAVKTVKAVGNTTVEVEYKEAVEKAAVENVSNYSVEGLEIKSAVLDGTKKVLLETAAQTAGKTYTLVVGEQKINFGGIAKVTGAPSLDKVEGTDTETIELTFDKVMDLKSIQDVANYAITGVTIESAKLDSARKVVTLTTKGLAANKTYSIKVTNIKSVDGGTLKSASKSFYSKSDKTAPKFPKLVVDTNTRLILTFTEEVTKESAEDLANYKITSGGTELAIEKAELKANDDDEYTIVELTTAAQKTGTRYTLAISNITDRSVLANTMKKTETSTFYAKSEDKSAPTFTKFEYLTANVIKVTLADASRLTKESVLDINNYTMNNDVVVEKAELFDEDDATNTIVKLTVSELGEKSSYELKVTGIKDEYGNEIKETKRTVTFVRSNVVKAATVIKAVATKVNEVKVYFDKEVVKATATDVANYSINNDINTPISASLDSTAKIVTLKTPELVAGKTYTITINGVTDWAENVIANAKPKFVGILDSNDIEAPTVESLEGVNKNVVRATFSEKIDTSVAKAPAVAFGTKNATTGVFTPGAISAAYAINVDDNKTILEFTNTASFTSTNASSYTHARVTAYDVAGNKVVEVIDFSPNTEDPEKVELLSWEQTSVKEFKLIYSQKVRVVTAAVAATPYALTASIDEDDDTIVYLTASQKMAIDKKFALTLSGKLTNYHGQSVTDPDLVSGTTYATKIETVLEDTDAPYIVSITAVDRNKVKLVFNEEMVTAGSYTVKYMDNKSKEQTWGQTARLDSSDATIVYLEGSTNLESRYIYALTVGTQAQDLSYNKLDKDTSLDFVGTDLVAIGNYVAGVNVINGSTFEVVPFSTVAVGGTYTVTLVYGSNDTSITIPSANVVETQNTAGTKVTKWTVTLPTDNALLKDVSYKVTVAGVGDYTFKGMVETGITVEKNTTNFLVTYADMKDGDVVTIVGAAPATVASGVASIGLGSLSGTTTDIYVTRDGVVIYFEQGYVLP